MEPFSSFTAIAGTLKATQETLRVALESRDLIKNAPLLQQLNAAQQNVFALNAQLFELQNQYLETAQDLAKLKQSAVERDRYALSEITKGVFALKFRGAPASVDGSHEGLAEPEHFICQPCLDGRGQKVVLQRVTDGWGSIALKCPSCNTELLTGEVIRTALGRSVDPGF
ncbi:hypothetical protein [Rhodanobacter hydrolyticus]|uniref:Uncharacterized protein n=1 Tax=Rhodanobacter hydrolyticus TaxID=2250595 RepID=A0ABW8J3X5_9GAMM